MSIDTARASRKVEQIDQLVDKLASIGIVTNCRFVQILLAHLGSYSLKTLLEHCDESNLRKWYEDAGIIVQNKLCHLLGRLSRMGVHPLLDDILNPDVNLDDLIFSTNEPLRAKVETIIDRGYKLAV